MGDMNFPDSPAPDEGYLDWSWDGEKWVHNGLTGLESMPANITTANVKLTNPQRADFKTQEDANNYFYESIESGSGGDGQPFPEAPLDGKQYGRQDAGWTEIVHSGGGGGGNDPRITDQQITDWDISFGWGDHSGLYLETETDPTVPQYVKDITQADINKWNNPPTGGGGGGAVDSVNGKTGAVTLNYSDVGAQVAGSYASSSHNHSGVYQPAGSYAASNHNHNGVYQPVGNYATTSYSYSKNESDGKYALKGSGGSDPNAVKLTGDQTISGAKTFNDVLYFSNMFIKGVTAGGVGIGGKARIEFAPGNTTIYSGKNTLQVNDAIGTAITGGLNLDNGGVRASSFNTSLIGSPSTSVMSYFGRTIFSEGAGGCGFYFGNGTAITPTGPSDVQLDGEISLGNPTYKWFRVWAATTYSSERTMQNDNEAVLSVNDLIDVMQDLRTATKDEKTVEGLRDSIGNCVGGIIEKLEAIQSAAEEERQKAIEEDERNQAEEEQRRIQESKLRTELPKEQ